MENIDEVGILSFQKIFHHFENLVCVENKAPLSQIKVLPFKEKNEWTLEPKYNIGKKGNEDGDQRTDNPSS